MAKITGTEVEFEPADLEQAWGQAIKLENADENKIKMCYICKFHMNKENYFNPKKEDILQWKIDLIDLGAKDLFNQDNLIAIHLGCEEFRNKTNVKKRVEKIRKVKWNFDEEFHQ